MLKKIDEWHRWFAWFEVFTDDGYAVWLRWIWRRRLWCGYAKVDLGVWEYRIKFPGEGE